MRKSRIRSLMKAACESGRRWSRKVRCAAVVIAGLSAGVGQWGSAGEALAKCLGGACHLGHLHHFAKRHPIVVPYYGPVVMPYCVPTLRCAPTVRVVRVVKPFCSPCAPVYSVPVRVVYRPVASPWVQPPTFVCGVATRVVKVVPSCSQLSLWQAAQQGIAQPILPIASLSTYPAPSASWGGLNVNPARLAGESPRLGLDATEDQPSTGTALRLVSFLQGVDGNTGSGMELAFDEELPTPAIRVERAKPGIAPLRPGEGVWDASAIGILDDLVRRGEFGAALHSCESMAKNSQGMSKGVSLRHAVLKLFAPESESELASVLDLLNTACAAGSNLHGGELGGGALRKFLESTPVSLDESLNQFSRLTLENPEIAVGNLLLISALLKLDGQEVRSRIFAEEAFERASQTGELNWSSLMMTLRRS